MSETDLKSLRHVLISVSVDDVTPVIFIVSSISLINVIQKQIIDRNTHQCRALTSPVGGNRIFAGPFKCWCECKINKKQT